MLNGCIKHHTIRWVQLAFFEKIEKEGKGPGIPEFLSTHPNPDNRIANMNKKWRELGGKSGKTYIERYQEFQTWVK